MTAPRDPRPDPLDRLRRPFDPLPPPPGTFEAVLARARARRRHRAQLAGVAAALAAIAGGATLLVTRTTGEQVLAPAGSPSAATGPTAPGSTAPGPAARPLAGTPGGPPSPGAAPPTALPSGPVGGPVPAGFQARSVTFVSARLGWVLGVTPTCGTPPCTSLLRTVDSGRTFRGIPAPVVPLSDPAGPAAPGTAGEVRFATALDGFVYGRGLWTTHDGGATWRRVRLPGGDTVRDLAASGGRTYLVVERCDAAGTDCRDATLYRVAAGSDELRAVPGFPRLGLDAHLAVRGRAVYVASRAAPDQVAYELRVSTDGGQTSAVRGPVCGRGLGGLSAGPSGVLWAGCNGGAGGAQVSAVVSDDEGRTFRVTDQSPPVDRGVASAAAVGPRRVVLTGEDTIADTRDGGRTWWRVSLPGADPKVRLVFVGFTDAAHGYVVAGGGGPPALWRTADGGASWRRVAFL